MKARSGLLFAAMLTVAVAGTMAWWCMAARHERERLQGTLQGKRAGLRLQLSQKEQAAGAIARERDTLRAALAAAAPGAPGSPHLRKPVETYTPAQAAEMLRFATTPWEDYALRSDPALRSEYLASERVNLDTRYGPLLGRLGLGPEQADKFKDLMAAHAQALLQIRLAALPGGAAEPNATLSSRETADERLRTAQAELLGDAGYRQLQEYERLLPLRYEVDGLAGSLVLTDTPLGASQAEQLIQIIANASSSYQKGAAADTPMPGNGEILMPLMLAHQSIDERNVDWDSVLAQARTVLSPDQLEQFSNQVGRNRIVVRLYNLIHDYPGDPMVGFTFGRR
jgi:hypothetical protein